MNHSIDNFIGLGIPGSEVVLPHGLVPGCTYLVQGGPGAGKTTFGLHFLTADPGATGMFITLGESVDQLQRNAQKMGFPVQDINFVDLLPADTDPREGLEYSTVFPPSERSEASLLQEIAAHFDTHRPQRVFVDSMTYFRFLAPDTFQFRKQILSLFRHLTEKGATVLLSSEWGAEAQDEDLQFLCDGILQLEQMPHSRTLSVVKLRGSTYLEGKHEMRIKSNGMRVFPRLIPGQHKVEFSHQIISSGVPELDELMHGGVNRGTVTVISGPSGAGKTTLGVQFMKEAAGRGEKSVVYSFEEATATILHRCQGVNIPIETMLDHGTLRIESVEPLHYTPDEFASTVRHDVEERGVGIVMLDSLSGYSQSVHGSDMVFHLHALCRYLRNMGITVLMINEVESIAGDEFRGTEQGISYLADAILMLRYLEVHGSLHKSIGVLKKRTGDFERSLRRFEITAYGIKVGEPLTGLHGILRGIPELIDPEHSPF